MLRLNKPMVCFFVSVLVMVLIPSCGKQKVESINVGVLLPLTGDIAVYGQTAKNGMEIALGEDKGFIEQNHIKVIYEDEKNETKTAVNAVNKLISVDNCKVLLEGGSSSCVLAIAPVAQNNQRILLATFASSPMITDAGDYVFRIMPSDAFQASLLPIWIKEFNYKKIAIIYQKNDWGLALREKFKEIWIKEGRDITFDEGVENQQKEFRSLISKLKAKAKDSDALFLPVYPIEAGNLLKQLYESKVTLPIFGADMFENQELLKIAGKAADGAKFLAPMPYHGEEYKSFALIYKSKYNVDPDLPACAGYDAMKTVLLCMKMLNSDKKEISSENIKTYLYDKINFVGATGRVKFDTNGDPDSKTFSRRVVENGKIVELQQK